MALYNVRAGTSQQIAWEAASSNRKPVSSWLVFNRDLINPVYIVSDLNGYGPDLNPADINPLQSSLVTALEQKALAPGLNWWAIAPASNTDTVQLEVTPDATSAVVSPAEIQEQLNALGLATSTNQVTQISAAGTSNNYLGGTIPGALISAAGLSVAKDMLNANSGVTTELAALIASGSPSGTPGGVPLLHGFNEQISNVTYTLTAGQALTVATLNLTRPGYFINVTPEANAASTNPFVGVFMQWQDSGGQLIYADRWYLSAASTASGTNYQGKGIQKASKLGLHLVNYDLVNSMQVTVTYVETTQHANRDDWRQTALSNVPGFTKPPDSDPNGLILAGGTTALAAAGDSDSYLIPLYCGPVWLYTENNQNNSLALESLNPQIGVGLDLFSISLINTQLPAQLVMLPRAPVQFTIANTTSPTAALTVTWSMVPLEYAS